jgi:hypothetical protein
MFDSFSVLVGADIRSTLRNCIRCMFRPTCPMVESLELWSVVSSCGLSLAAAAWSHVRGNPVWVTVCVGLPGALVGWAALEQPYSLLRHLAAVVAFPLALAGGAKVTRARGRRQRG